MSNKKKCIEYALHSYDIFWEYYKKTLDERNRILNNYMIFVGIPISILSIFIEKAKNNFNKYWGYGILFLCFIFLLGIIMYKAYIIEGFVSENYLTQIKNITKYLIDNYDKDYNNVFKETYGFQSLFLNKKNSQEQRINKSLIIIIGNTIVIITICLMFYKYNIIWCHVILAITISTITHAAIFNYCKKQISR